MLYKAFLYKFNAAYRYKKIWTVNFSIIISWISWYKGKQWITKIHRDPGCNSVVNQNTKVCLLHFTVDNYVGGDAVSAKRHVLKSTPMPTIFP